MQAAHPAGWRTLVFAFLALFAFAAPAHAQSTESAVGNWYGVVDWVNPSTSATSHFDLALTFTADGEVVADGRSIGRWVLDGDYLRVRYIGGYGARMQLTGRLNRNEFRADAIAFNPDNKLYFEGVAVLRR